MEGNSASMCRKRSGGILDCPIKTPKVSSGKADGEWVLDAQTGKRSYVISTISQSHCAEHSWCMLVNATSVC